MDVFKRIVFNNSVLKIIINVVFPIHFKQFVNIIFIINIQYSLLNSYEKLVLTTKCTAPSARQNLTKTNHGQKVMYRNLII